MSWIFSIIKRRAGGYSLVELILYVGLLSLILMALLGVVNQMLRSYARSQVERALATSGESAMERMSRDIRSATGIGASSVFSTSTSDLVLDTTDALGNPTTVEFSVASSTLWVTEGSGAPAALLASGVSVEEFALTKITTSNSQGMRIILGLQASTSAYVSQGTFYDTVILRGTY